MNTRTTLPQISSRAQFSPVLRRATGQSLTVGFARIRQKLGEIVPRADTLTPGSPTRVARWWDPHLVDRLQPPLTRYRD